MKSLSKCFFVFFCGMFLTFFIARELYVSLAESNFLSLYHILQKAKESPDKKMVADLVSLMEVNLVMSVKLGGSFLGGLEAVSETVADFDTFRSTYIKEFPNALQSKEVEMEYKKAVKRITE